MTTYTVFRTKPLAGSEIFSNKMCAIATAKIGSHQVINLEFLAVAVERDVPQMGHLPKTTAVEILDNVDLIVIVPTYMRTKVSNLNFITDKVTKGDMRLILEMGPVVMKILPKDTS